MFYQRHAMMSGSLHHPFTPSADQFGQRFWRLHLLLCRGHVRLAQVCQSPAFPAMLPSLPQQLPAPPPTQYDLTKLAMPCANVRHSNTFSFRQESAARIMRKPQGPLKGAYSCAMASCHMLQSRSDRTATSAVDVKASAWMLPSASICCSGMHSCSAVPGRVSYASTLTAVAPAAFPGTRTAVQQSKIA